MWAKLVFSAVLCLALNQVCLARPQESHISEHVANDIQYVPETRITNCRGSLRQIVRTLADLSYDFGLLYTELLAALVETIKCVILSGSNLVQCEQKVLSDTVAGLKDAISDFASNIVRLGENLGGGVQSCLLQGNMLRYEQLFLNSNYIN